MYMKTWNSHKFIFFLLRFIVYTFIIFFTSAILFSFGFLFYFSSHEMYISSKTTIGALTKIINVKNKEIDLSFSSIYFKQSSLKDMKFDIIFQNLNILQKKSKLLIVSMGDVEIFISPQEAISGQFIPKINEISNKTIHIPITTNGKKNKHNNQPIKTALSSNDINSIVKETSLLTQNILQNTKLILRNGIEIRNTNINLLDVVAGKQINSFKIKDFYLKTTTFNQLTEAQKHDFDNLIDKNAGNNYKISGKTMSLSKKLYHKLSILNKKYINDITIYKISIDYHGQNVMLSGLCEYNKLGIASSCLINIQHLPLILLSGAINITKLPQLNSIIEKTSLDGMMHLTLDENGINSATIDGSLRQRNVSEMKIKSKQIKQIKFTAKTSDNFSKIRSAIINLYDNKNNIISNITTNNATFENGLLKNSNVYFTINNIKLSDFYTFIDNTFLTAYKNIKHIDGVINGTLCFSFNSDGNLIQSVGNNHNNQIQLKRLIVNSKLFDFDLSKFIFSLEIIKNNIVLKTKNVNKHKIGEIVLQYDYLKNGLEATFYQTILTKPDFNQFKQLFLDVTQFNIMKNIELSLLVNGKVFIPFDKKSFSKESLFNLTLKVLSTDDDLDDEILLKLHKQNNTKRGNVEIDFGKSVMYSQLFAFGKQENDISIIKGTFDFVDGKDIGLKINTSWKLNNVEQSTFTFSFIDNIVYALLKSKISQLEVVQKGREYKVGLSGSSVYVDYEFWHIILLLISFLSLMM